MMQWNRKAKRMCRVSSIIVAAMFWITVCAPGQENGVLPDLHTTLQNMIQLADNNGLESLKIPQKYDASWHSWMTDYVLASKQYQNTPCMLANGSDGGVYISCDILMNKNDQAKEVFASLSREFHAIPGVSLVSSVSKKDDEIYRSDKGTGIYCSRAKNNILLLISPQGAPSTAPIASNAPAAAPPAAPPADAPPATPPADALATIAFIAGVPRPYSASTTWASIKKHNLGPFNGGISGVSAALSFDASGCNATISGGKQPYAWSLRDGMQISVQPVTATEVAFSYVNIDGKKVDEVMTSVGPMLYFLNLHTRLNGSWTYSTLAFLDQNQANAVARALRRLVSFCGGASSDYADADLQKRIDKARKDAAKVPGTWSAFKDAVTQLGQYETDPVGYQMAHEPDIVNFFCWAKPQVGSSDSRVWMSKNFSTDLHQHSEGEIEGQFVQYVQTMYPGELLHLCVYNADSSTTNDLLTHMFNTFKNDGDDIIANMWPAGYEY